MPMPPVGASGVYVLDTPFNTKLLNNTSYRCDAIRRFNDLYEMSIDPYEEFYRPAGVSKERFDADVASQTAIVSLVSQNNHWVYVPSSFIRSFPNVNGIPYTSLVLGVTLGAIPNYMDLSGLYTAVSNLVRDTIGVSPQIQSVAVSNVTNLSQQDHDRLEAARLQNVNNSTTDRAKYIALQKENAMLRQQLMQLENYVKTNLP